MSRLARLGRSACSLLLLGSLASAQSVFGPPLVSPGGPQLTTVVLADVDGDRKLDLLGIAQGDLYVQHGDGRGRFGPRVSLGLPYAVIAVRTGDFDADGTLDLVALSFGGIPKLLYLFPGLGGGAFDAPAIHELGTVIPFSLPHLSVGDADGDGDLDVYAVNADFSLATGFTHLMLNDGAGGFTALPVLGPGRHTRGLALDLDADGLPDVVQSAAGPLPDAPHSLRLLRGQPGGGFVEHTVFEPAGLLAVEDVDADGLPDLVTATVPDATTGVHVRRGLGGFGFAPPQGSAAGKTAVTVGRFDDDAHADLMTVSGPVFRVWHGVGDGSFQASAPALLKVLGAPVYVGAGDANGDGRLDPVFLRQTSQGTGEVEVVLHANHSYPADGPLLDVGHALPGPQLVPGTLAVGDFTGGSVVKLLMHSAKTDFPVTLMIGLSEVYQQWAGGVIVPFPQLVLNFGVPDASGTFSVIGHWPHEVPAGTSVTWQFWQFEDAFSAHIVASSAVRVTTR